MTARGWMCAGLASVLLAAPSLAACGGGGGGEKRDHGARGEEAEQEAAKAKLPAADRIAFYQLATTIGMLRTQAAAAAAGRPGGAAADGRLASAAARVTELRPRNGALTALRDRLAAALRSRPGPDANRAAGRATLAATSELIAGLQRYARTRPEYQALLPD